MSSPGPYKVSPIGKVAKGEAAYEEAQVEDGLVHVGPPGVSTHQVKL